jgi:hypothetical protein
MAYIISGTTKSAELGAMSQQAPDIHEALRKARQMVQIGMVSVSIQDTEGHKIGGDDLIACVEGKKTLSDDLKVIARSAHASIDCLQQPVGEEMATDDEKTTTQKRARDAAVLAHLILFRRLFTEIARTREDGFLREQLRLALAELDALRAAVPGKIVNPITMDTAADDITQVLTGITIAGPPKKGA